MRRRGAPLMRVAATTAVVAGTAGAVSHHQQQKYARQDYENQQMYAQQAVPAQPQVVYVQAPPEPVPAPAPVPAAAAPDLTAQLQQLAQLHTAGVLSDEEFAAAKQKLIAG